jgi:trans-aconitate methyltransferase
MIKAEFDSVVADYEAQHAASIRLSGESTGYFADYKAEDVRRITDAAECEPTHILDFGSGVGNSVAPLLRHYPKARLTCLDVSTQSLEFSRQRHGDAAQYYSYDGQKIPADIGTFDLIFTACVFHHIPESKHITLLRQLKIHLNPGGIFALFEHNPWNPLTRYAVNTCPFDEQAVLISASKMRRRLRKAGFDVSTAQYRMFFPRAMAVLRPLERYMTTIPFGAQYALYGK